MNSTRQPDRNDQDDARLHEKLAPIIFVHIGTGVPAHFLPSLQRATTKYAGEVVALVNRQETKLSYPKGLSVVWIEDFYDSSVFLDSEAARTWGRSFRNGFFLKCLERFFVLDQYIKRVGHTKFFHAESDVVTFRLEQLGRALDKQGSGLFVPRDHDERAIASLIYCNRPDSLNRLIHFALQTTGFDNEMQLLAQYLDTESSAFALPTVRVWEDSSQSGRKSLTIQQAGGLFDAAGLGQWVGGIDPRNTPFPVFNRFQNEKNATDFSELRFRFNSGSNTLKVKRRGDKHYIEVFNLHIHSKLVSLFKSNLALAAVIWASRLPLRLPLEFKAKKWGLAMHKILEHSVANLPKGAKGSPIKRP